MTAFTRVAAVGEIPENQGRCFTVNGKRVAVFNKGGGNFFALDDACTHVGGSLSEGELSGDSVVCPWHGAMFSLHNGACAGPPARGGVKAYPCRVNGSDVEVGS